MKKVKWTNKSTNQPSRGSFSVDRDELDDSIRGEASITPERRNLERDILR